MGISIVDLITSIVPYGSTADVLINTWRDKKLKEAQEIILSEIREGVFDNTDIDDTISIVHRLWRAISEGVAKNNFRLMCRLVQGLGDNEQLIAPTFLRFASLLDSLTEDEIKVIALDIWLHKNPKPNISSEVRKSMGKATAISWVESQEYKKWKAEACIFMAKSKIKIDVEKFFDKLAAAGKYIIAGRNPFSETHFALLRTGLYSMEIKTQQRNESGDGIGYGTFSFSPLMFDFMKYVDFYLEHKE